MRIENIKLQVHRMPLTRSVCKQRLDRLDRLLSQVVAVLCFQRERLAVFLHNPSSRGITWSLTILQTEDDLPRVLLRLHAQASLIRKKVIVIKDRGGPPIPRLVVLSERIQKLLGSDMTLANLACNITYSLQILREDNIVRAKLRL